MSKFSQFDNQATYLATGYIAGYDSSGVKNIRTSLPDFVTLMKGKLEDATVGLDLDAMYDSNGNHILSTRKGAIISITNSTGTVGGDEIFGYTLSSLTDSTGGSTSDLVLATCGDTSASDQSTIINDNFAKTAFALNAIVTALNGSVDSASLRDKIEEILVTLRDTTGHGLIST